MKQNHDHDNMKVIYLDETWMNAHDGKERYQEERDRVTGKTLSCT